MDDNRDLEELLAEIEADAKEKYGADGAGIISKLRSDLRHERKESARLSAENADLRDRLEQAERERDEAREDIKALVTVLRAQTLGRSVPIYCGGQLVAWQRIRDRKLLEQANG